MENIHPIFVHFPIALTFMALLFAFLAIIAPGKRELMKEMLMWTLLLGALAAIATAATGLYASNNIPHNEAIHKIMIVHKTYGIIIGTSFLVLSLWMILRRVKMRVGELVFLTVFLAALTGLTGYSASLGGEMVYEHGAGVVPMMEMMRSETHHHATGEEHVNGMSKEAMQDSMHKHIAGQQEIMHDSMQAMGDSTMNGTMHGEHDHSGHH